MERAARREARQAETVRCTTPCRSGNSLACCVAEETQARPNQSQKVQAEGQVLRTNCGNQSERNPMSTTALHLQMSEPTRTELRLALEGISEAQRQKIIDA